jgi:hypothetical protein
LIMMERETVPSMSITDEIHHSIADADDMEEVWDRTIDVVGVFRNLAGHPAQIFTRWNWKTALLGAGLRAFFYLVVYVVSQEAWITTLTAVMVELPFRFITTGMAGSVVQSFRRATPVWAANIIVSILLPAFSHTVEFLTHYGQERYFSDILAASRDGVARQRTFAISVFFSVISALFNLFAMRHGVLLVGAGKETLSFGSDVKRLPLMVSEFTAFLPVLIAKYFERRQFLSAFASIVGFGVTVGIMLGTFRGKWEWAWRSTLGAWAVLLFSVTIAAVARYVMKRQGKTYHKRY